MRWVFFIAAAAIIGTPLVGQAAEPGAAAIEAQISRDGARVVVHRLTAGSGASWNNVTAHIGSGQKAWLDVARDLRPGVDAGPGEDLTGAVATALRHNPTGVLKMIGPDFALENICDVPLIEPSDAQTAQWKHAVLVALDHVKDTSLTDKVRQCRAQIGAIK
jgi:hypothetical protein